MYTNATKIKAKNPNLTQTDEYLNQLANIVSAHIDSYLGFKLASNEVKDIYIDGSGTEYLIPDYPINLYTIITRIFRDSEMQIDTADIISYPLNKPYTTYFALRKGIFAEGMANFKVQGARVGMFYVDLSGSGTTLPSEIIDLATNLAVKLAEEGGVKLENTPNTDGMKKSSEQMGSYSVGYTADNNLKEIFNSDITASSILEKYKIPVIV